MNFSDHIRQCREGVVRNPYQGDDKKVVFVCSMGILRSATGARLYSDKHNTRTAGTWEDALVPLTPILIAWADEIVFVHRDNYEGALKRFGKGAFDEVPSVRILNIPDRHPHMHIELIKAFSEQYEPLEIEIMETR
jgi:predicted protein tyrosine phosphatase